MRRIGTLRVLTYMRTHASRDEEIAVISEKLIQVVSDEVAHLVQLVFPTVTIMYGTLCD